MKYAFFITRTLIIWLAPFIVMNAACQKSNRSTDLSKTKYVDNTVAVNGNGSSWNGAWKSFSSIAWNKINPGDTIQISGGADSQTYFEQLYVRKSGADSLPIVITCGQTRGHNGKVIIESPDRYCALKIGDNTHDVIVNGNYLGKRNIVIQKSKAEGVGLDGNARHISLKYLEICENGHKKNENGIHIQVEKYASPIVEISYCSIHDNWQDQIFVNGPASATTDYDQIIIHDNDIGFLSDDGIECLSGGVTFYNNTMHNITDQKRGEGHPDGMQIYQGYCRIYNNTFSNFHAINSDIFIELWTEPISRPDGHVYIYNNLFYESKISKVQDNYFRGIECLVSSLGGITRISDIVIANNTLVNIPAWGILLDPNLPVEKVSNIVMVNNIVHNCFTLGGGQAISIGDEGRTYTVGPAGSQAQVVCDYNIISAGNDGASAVGFMGKIYDYAQWVSVSHCNTHGYNADPLLDKSYSPSLKSSRAVGAGMDLSSLFSFDHLNKARPKGAWDIGAFQFPPAVKKQDKGFAKAAN